MRCGCCPSEVLVVLDCSYPLQLVSFEQVVIYVCHGVLRCAVCRRRVLVVNEAESAGLCQSLGLLLSDFEQVAAGVFFDAQGGIPDFVHVTGDPGHQKVVQMVVQRRRPLLQARIRLYFHLVSVACWQSDDGACVAHVLDQFVWSVTQGQDLAGKEYFDFVLEVVREFLLKRGYFHVATHLRLPPLIKVCYHAVELLLLQEID